MKFIFIVVLGIALPMRSVSAPPSAQDTATRNIGVDAIDANWGKSRDYLQRLIGSIQKQWDQTLHEGNIHPPAASIVTVKFVINSEGLIDRIAEVKNQGCSAEGAQVCVTAVKNAAPYGKWSEKMKVTLGNQQNITLSFYQQ